jgi:predicted cobalt transporter CbtA
MGIISTAKSKGIQGGYMSFKEAFSSYFITCAVGLAISTLVGILIFTIVDPELAQYLNERSMELAQEYMVKFGAPQAEIDKAMADLATKDNFSIVNQAKSYASLLIFHAVIGLLVGLIFKKKDPATID